MYRPVAVERAADDLSHFANVADRRIDMAVALASEPVIEWMAARRRSGCDSLHT